MSNESIYRKALEYFTDEVSGSSDFEKICRILVKFMYPDYDFRTPEGGQGTKDGGYDGRDPIKKAKLACSINKDYKQKIKSEVDKSKKNSDLQIIYLSNQVISEPEKISIEKEIDCEGVKLFISGIVELSKKIDDYFERNNGEELYDLLKLSSLKAGENYRRGDVKALDGINIDKPYKKKIIIIDRNLYGNHSENLISDNPLQDFILSCLSSNNNYSLRNICICGIGYLGKSYLMKNTFNYFLDVFSDKNNHNKYKFLPLIQFFELKYYSKGAIKDVIRNPIDPILIFLDGLDEVSESTYIELNSEIQNILSKSNHINFIISGRNSSFTDFEIFHNSSQLFLEKYIDPNDIELYELIIKYKNTPLEEFLPIPMYRNYVLENDIPINSSIDDLYSFLVRSNFYKDKERRDYSSKIIPRMTSDETIDSIIKNLSEFCHNLFITKKRVFSETDIKIFFNNNEYFIFIINSSIIDYRDKNQISFISNFYFEYFVANAFISKKRKHIIKMLFFGDNIKIVYIDIFLLFLNIVKSKNIKEYKYYFNKITKHNAVCILLSEFDIISFKERYDYFISIYNEYKKKNQWIYYGRFRQTYGVLKNIDNMANKMQQLLPYKYKIDAVNFLKREIDNFLKNPSKRYSLSFANAVILLIPFIKDLWTKLEQNILKELSLRLIKYFIYNELSQEIDDILSERFIFDWYQDFNWANEWDQKNWEQFYTSISGNSCNLFSEISDENEFSIKYNIFRISYKNEYNRPLLFPIIRYVVKYKYMDGCSMASTVPETLTDDYEMPIVKTDSRISELTRLLKGITLNVSDILDVLNYTINNNVYNHIKDSSSNPIKHFEETLYKNINLIEEEDFDKFSRYYFGIFEYEFDNRIFSENENVLFVNLSEYLINEIIKKNVYNWNTGFFLSRLINFTESEASIRCLDLIREKMPQKVYADIIYYIYNNSKHILHDNNFIIKECNTLFEKEIKNNIDRKKKLEEIKKEMEFVKANDILLLQNPDEMINEIKKIHNFLLSPETMEEHGSKFGGLFSLYYESILNTLSYSEKSINTPVFSECAIKLIEDFYRDDVFDINIITERLQDYLSKKENFYRYFYYYFIKKSRKTDNNDIDNIEIIEDIKQNKCLIDKIIESINIDIRDKFINKPIKFFENNINWLNPFIFYYRTLLNNIRPEWIQDEHILKLIVIPNPAKIEQVIIGEDLTLNWIIELFPTITPNQIIEYGLNIVDSLNSRFSRMQIVRYFINHIKPPNMNEYTDKIIEFIINSTKLLFEITALDHNYSEFQYIASYWRGCDSNFIDELFPKFTIRIVTSAIRKNNQDIDYQYRKDVLLYCCRVASANQKNRIVNDIENDINNKILSNDVKNEIQAFLASLGKEEAIKFIINQYLHGENAPSRFNNNNYPLGFIKQSDSLLNDYIDLLFYGAAKTSERRTVLYNMARVGIKQHLNNNNFHIFKKRMKKEIKKQIKLSNNRLEHYYEYLSQMEVSVSS
jgi:hypothetical protein